MPWIAVLILDQLSAQTDPLCALICSQRGFFLIPVSFFMFFFSLTKDIESLDALISVCVCVAHKEYTHWCG